MSFLSIWTQFKYYRVWQDVPVVVIVSMLAYFCFLEQLLVTNMGTSAIAMSLPFLCIYTWSACFHDIINQGYSGNDPFKILHLQPLDRVWYKWQPSKTCHLYQKIAERSLLGFTLCLSPRCVLLNTQILSVLIVSISLSCVCSANLGFFTLLHQKRNLGGGYKMACCLNKSDLGLERKTRVVLPAYETHAEEATAAIKSGKVIAVPTDTLYGFASDAWQRCEVITMGGVARFCYLVSPVNRCSSTFYLLLLLPSSIWYGRRGWRRSLFGG
ncbi:hypothetical protein NE237_008906 [Protea cynaroides]|uniref:Uncharacterized protein n=1 Tax=Protea cynaroides TaxID=273540 RepID=A0A9Q0KXL9_9MAGN|nr:hypothetical protein NE237_008906 [Protea cynaroides]